MIKNIVFDLGGVVIGRDYDIYGGELAEFSFLQGDRPFPRYWKDYDLGLGSRDSVVKAVASESGITLADASAKLDLLMSYFNEYGDTAALIGELHGRGYRIFALSNMPPEFIGYVKKFGVFRYFEGLVISSEEHLAKPDPRFFGILTGRYGLLPGETLFVDDKPSNTNVAKELGFNVCLFTPGKKSCDGIREILKNNI